MTRILATGSREYTAVHAMRAALRGVGDEFGDGITLVHGGARGADRLAASIANAWGWRTEEWGADWEGACRAECGPHHRRRQRGRSGATICPAAGIYRNQRVVDAGADLVLAFFVAGLPCTGTRDCVRRADSAGIPVRVFTQGQR